MTNNNTNTNSSKEITKKKLQFAENAREDGTLSLGAKVVFTQLLLKHHNNEKGRCNPSEPTLARDLKISERNIQRFIKELKERGWLSVQRRHNKSNQYRFNWEV